MFGLGEYRPNISPNFITSPWRNAWMNALLKSLHLLLHTQFIPRTQYRTLFGLIVLACSICILFVGAHSDSLEGAREGGGHCLLDTSSSCLVFINSVPSGPGTCNRLPLAHSRWHLHHSTLRCSGGTQNMDATIMRDLIISRARRHRWALPTSARCSSTVVSSSPNQYGALWVLARTRQE